MWYKVLSQYTLLLRQTKPLVMIPSSFASVGNLLKSFGRIKKQDYFISNAPTSHSRQAEQVWWQNKQVWINKQDVSKIWLCFSVISKRLTKYETQFFFFLQSSRIFYIIFHHLTPLNLSLPSTSLVFLVIMQWFILPASAASVHTFQSSCHSNKPPSGSISVKVKKPIKQWNTPITRNTHNLYNIVFLSHCYKVTKRLLEVKLKNHVITLL